MPFDVMDGDAGQAVAKGESFRIRRADEQRTKQSRLGGARKRIDLLHANACLTQGLFGQRPDDFQMSSRGQFRNHASPLRMNGLGRDEIGKHGRSLNYGHGRIVARRFEGKDERGAYHD